MSWFNENKFLAIFGGAVLVGAGFLGYMAMGASSKYDEAQTKFKDASDKLKGLYGAQTYPMDENVKEYAARQKQIKGQIDQLQKALSVMKVRIDTTTDNITPNIFQDRLKEMVAKVVAKAGEKEVTLPKDFYLGFDRYKDKPPQSTAAAVALLKELRAVEIVTNLLIETKKVDIKELTREELKEEGGKAEPVNDKKGPKSDEKKKLVHKSSITVKFITTEAHFHSLVSAIAGNKEQLFVIRNLAAKNTVDSAPAKTPPGPPDPNKKEAPKLETIFGNERVEVTLEIDIVDVSDPEVVVASASGTKGGAVAKPSPAPAEAPKTPASAPKTATPATPAVAPVKPATAPAPAAPVTPAAAGSNKSK